jgi:hypothetical protein
MVVQRKAVELVALVTAFAVDQVLRTCMFRRSES